MRFLSSTRTSARLVSSSNFCFPGRADVEGTYKTTVISQRVGAISPRSYNLEVRLNKRAQSSAFDQPPVVCSFCPFHKNLCSLSPRSSAGKTLATKMTTHRHLILIFFSRESSGRLGGDFFFRSTDGRLWQMAKK